MMDSAKLVLLAWLLLSVAAPDCIADSNQEITVLTHYCPWYEPVGGIWQDGITGMPLLGLYRSTDPAVIGQHIQWANAYGIDCFVVEWSGLRNQQFNNNLKAILQHPDASKIKFSLVYAVSMALGTVWDQSEQGIPPSECDWSVNCSDPAVRTKFVNDMSYAAANYLWRDNFLRIRGRPAFYIWASAAMEGDVAGMLDEAREKLASKYGLGIYFIGEEVSWGSVPEPYRLRAFDAVMPYAMINVSVPPSDAYPMGDSIEGIIARYGAWRNVCRDLGIDFIPSVMPGYDDKNRTLYYTEINGILDTPAPVAERSTEDFRALCSNVLDFVDPEVGSVFVTSWNEWFEGTTVEPSVHYGFEYLQIINETLLSCSPGPRQTHRLVFGFSRTVRPIDIYPDSTDTRDLSVAFETIELLDINRTPMQTIQVASAGARASMGLGWYGDEGTDFVWAGGADAFASLYMPVPEGATFIRVQATSCPPNVTVTVSVDGNHTGGMFFDQTWTTQDTLLCPTSIQLNLSEHLITIGSAAHISGISPMPSHSVLIHYREDGNCWHILANLTGDLTGHFQTDWTPPSAAVYELVALSPWAPGQTALASPTVGLTVARHARAITMSASGNSVTLGSSVGIRGTVDPPAAGTEILLSVEPPDGGKVTMPIRADGEGAFTYTITANRTGLWTIAANCPANATHDAADGMVTFMVTKRSSGISWLAGPCDREIGESLAVSGQLTPPLTGEEIIMTIVDPSGASHEIAAETDARGKFNHGFRPWYLGSWAVTAEWEGDESYLGTHSLALRFGVTQESATSLERFVYYDPAYPTMWITAQQALAYRDFLVSNGFRQLDSPGLQNMMEGRGANTIVVMAQDVIPDRVVYQQEDPPIHRYFAKGGTVVWIGDIPFYYVGFPDGSFQEWGTEGLAEILGVSISDWEDVGEVQISAAGRDIGLNQTWVSARPVPMANVSEVFASVEGKAAAWLKNLCPLIPNSGFIRLWDNYGGYLSTDHLADLLCVSGKSATGPLSPIADFTFAPGNPGPGDELAFIDLSWDLDGSVVEWLWDFGDGETSSLPDPVHRYVFQDNFEVTLTVRDNDGHLGVASTTLTIGQQPIYQACAGLAALSLLIRRRSRNALCRGSTDP